MTVCLGFLPFFLDFLAENPTQRSVSEEVCVGQFALNTHSSHPPGIFMHTHKTEKTQKHKKGHSWLTKRPLNQSG